MIARCATVSIDTCSSLPCVLLAAVAVGSFVHSDGTVQNVGFLCVGQEHWNIVCGYPLLTRVTVQLFSK